MNLHVNLMNVIGATGQLHRHVQQPDTEDDIDAGVELRALRPGAILAQDGRRHVHPHADAVQPDGPLAAQEADHHGQSGPQVEADPQHDVQVLHLADPVQERHVPGLQHGPGLRRHQRHLLPTVPGVAGRHLLQAGGRLRDGHDGRPARHPARRLSAVLQPAPQAGHVRRQQTGQHPHGQDV